MKMRYTWLLSIITMVMALDAAPKTVQVKNGSKKAKLTIKNSDHTPIKNQPEYTLVPNEVKNVAIINGPGSYIFSLVFVGLERGGDANMAVEIKPNTTLVIIDDAWEIKQYNYAAAYIKQLDTPEPEVYGGSW